MCYQCNIIFQIKHYEDLLTISSSQTNNTNSSQIQCVAFNLCDYLKVNITREQLYHAYLTKHGEYNNFQAFLLSEWRSFMQDSTSEKEPAPPSTSDPAWKRYINHTRSAVTEFLDTMNSTWQDISNLSKNIVKGKLVNKTKRVQNKLTNVASIISRGVGVVKQKLAKVFDGNVYTGTSSSSNEDLQDLKSGHVPRNDEVARGRVRTPKKPSEKFHRRFNALTNAMSELDLLTVDAMKRYFICLFLHITLSISVSPST